MLSVSSPWLCSSRALPCCLFFFQAEDGIRDHCVTGVQTCALPILPSALFALTSRMPLATNPMLAMLYLRLSPLVARPAMLPACVHVGGNVLAPASVRDQHGKIGR